MPRRRAIVDDVPEWDPNSDEDAREDAAWRDLVARYDTPLSAQEPVPWPEREEMTPAIRGAAPVAPAPGPGARVDDGPRDSTKSDPDAEHRYVPPPPPPLPKLDPLAKAAWVALFGGPGYLLIATAMHWSMPGLFVFIAVAAFVTGVALLVFRLNDSDRNDSDDDGAVV
jgi:hypothetical protein